MVSLAKKLKVKKFIYISSMAVYGNAIKAQEYNTHPNPISFYGVSKLACEKITLKYNYSVYQGVNFWNSDGSFTRIWETAIKHNNTVILHNKKHIIIDF